eukprot:4388227-Karenia_brevis.AAC.1
MEDIAAISHVASWAGSLHRILQVPGIPTNLLDLPTPAGSQFQAALAHVNAIQLSHHPQSLPITWRDWTTKPAVSLQRLLTTHIDKANLQAWTAAATPQDIARRLNHSHSLSS